MRASKTAVAAAILALIGLIGPQTASASHTRPKAATPFRASLVPAYEPCTVFNRVHAAPFSHSSCNPPVQSSPNVTVGTPDANLAPAKSVASVLFRSVGVAGGPDDQDVEIVVEATDVRCQAGVSTCGSANSAGGADYVGQLEANTPFQLTDHNSGPTGVGSDPSTVLQTDFPITVSCAATSDTTEGSSCSLTTSMDAQVPMAIPESKRMIMELDQVTLWDGGPDGNVLTPDNSLFFVQGVAVP
jgi:hypothetical protein